MHADVSALVQPELRTNICRHELKTKRTYTHTHTYRSICFLLCVQDAGDIFARADNDPPLPGALSHGYTCLCAISLHGNVGDTKS